MRTVIVAVNYSDLLAVTLPYNRHHWEEVYIVTSTADLPNVAPICAANDAQAIATDLFYSRGAKFNKWAALEFALDRIGRHGWLCLADADVLWPKTIPDYPRTAGNLYVPYRRMMTDLPRPFTIPPESEWKRFPIHQNVREFAGYSQLFNASDPHLGPPPWHDVDWTHAGGADSFFQRKWPNSHKIRPPFEVLHLGEPGANWAGRATSYLDGSTPPDARQKREYMTNLWRGRRGKQGADRFAGEKLPPG